VAVRLRPLNRNEQEDAWKVQENTLFLLDEMTGKVSDTVFQYDNTYGPETLTKDVYAQSAKAVLDSTLMGLHGTIFAYGQTSSGKTHTMTGTDADPGIIPLIVSELFERTETDKDRDYSVRCSYLEIYNEELKDLLGDGSPHLRQSLDEGVHVAGALELEVHSPKEVIEALQRGEVKRAIGATNMNVRSSRSHCVFRLFVSSTKAVQDGKTNRRRRGVSDVTVRRSVLTLVDLAGSERQSKSGAMGKRLREGSCINRSLLTLGQCIKALVEGGKRHVPYRDSKLTRLLQPALGGNR
ncbi:kinesin-like protein, partial [Kipferlia bialata]